eukprot:1352251-Pyramimonas_sp.AAC.1
MPQWTQGGGGQLSCCIHPAVGAGWMGFKAEFCYPKTHPPLHCVVGGWDDAVGVRRGAGPPQGLRGLCELLAWPPPGLHGLDTAGIGICHKGCNGPLTACKR